ncbi:hypothetical protein OVN18_04385 [Microcella daejeonensis]|uniref:Uncharacterized protein n=1 Tax=Microcella daejeonensis TaxID=2994971 RepID=A0A9E8S9D8_9MICO|nr:hypothetical protein [Microcella daejeonensis]WAB82253.1 hypothetical protein OVN18_04385 [Microcella daejeonensis]
MKADTSRSWLYEPVLAAAIGLAALAAWVIAYSLQLRASGLEPSSASAPDTSWQESLLGASWLLLVLVWVVVAALLNRLVGAATAPRRMAVSFAAAVVVIAPFLALTVLGLAESDGWRGIGVVLLLFQLSVPALAVGLHLLALPLASRWDRQRRSTGLRSPAA